MLTLALWLIAAQTPSPAPPLPPYPAEYIDQARSTGASTCMSLVYKQGCTVTRTGTITVHVTLDDKGRLLTAKVTSNTVKNDRPKVVERCLLKSLPEWKFIAPVNVQPDFDVTVVFGDKC